MGLASDHGARAENLEEVVPRLRDAVDRETGDRLVYQLSLWAAVDDKNVAASVEVRSIY